MNNIDELLKSVKQDGADLFKAILDYALFRHRRPIVGAARVAFDRLVNDSPARTGALWLIERTKASFDAVVFAGAWLFRGIIIGLVLGSIGWICGKLGWGAEQYFVMAGYAAIAVTAVIANALIFVQFVKMDVLQKGLAFLAIAGKHGLETALKLVPFIENKRTGGLESRESGMVKTAVDKADGFMKQVAGAFFWIDALIIYTLVTKPYENPMSFALVPLAAIALYFKKHAFGMQFPKLYRAVAAFLIMGVFSSVAYYSNVVMVDSYVCAVAPDVCLWWSGRKLAQRVRDQVAPVKELLTVQRTDEMTTEATRLMTEIRRLEKANYTDAAIAAGQPAADAKALLLYQRIVDWNLMGRNGLDPRLEDALAAEEEAKKNTVATVVKPKATCEDGLDNDGDKLIDSNDQDCYSPDSSCAKGQAGCKGFTLRSGLTSWRRYVPALDEKPAATAAPTATTAGTPKARGGAKRTAAAAAPAQKPPP